MGFTTLLGLLLASTAFAAKNHFVSSPFDNFRIECPKGSGATALGVKMVESVGAARQDVVFDMSCDDVNEIYPWINMPGGVKSVEREDCYYSKMFDPIIDDDIDMSCRAREYMAGITRISETRIQVLCCRLRSRDEFNCGELTFNKPLGLARSSIIENENMLINGLSIQGMTYKVRFCDLSPRSIDEIMNDVPPNRRKAVRISTTKSPPMPPGVNPYLKNTLPPTTTTVRTTTPTTTVTTTTQTTTPSTTVPVTTTPRFIQVDEISEDAPAGPVNGEELEPLSDADLLSLSSELEYENPIDINAVPLARGVAQVQAKPLVNADGLLKGSSFSIDAPASILDKKPAPVIRIKSTTPSTTTEETVTDTFEETEGTKEVEESVELSDDDEITEDKVTTTEEPTTTTTTTTTPVPTTTQRTTTTDAPTTRRTTTTTPEEPKTTAEEETTTRRHTTRRPTTTTTEEIRHETTESVFTPNFDGAQLDMQESFVPVPVAAPRPLMVPNPVHHFPLKNDAKVNNAVPGPQMKEVNEEISRLIKRIQDAQSEREQVALFQQSISTLLNDGEQPANDLTVPSDRLTVANLDFPQKPSRNQQMSLRGNRISKADLPLRSSPSETRAHADASYLLLKSIDDQRRAPVRSSVHPYVRGVSLEDDKKEVSKNGEVSFPLKPKPWRVQFGNPNGYFPTAPPPVVHPSFMHHGQRPGFVQPAIRPTTTTGTSTSTTTTTTRAPIDPLLFEKKIELTSEEAKRISDVADYVDPDTDSDRDHPIQQRADIVGKTHERSNRRYRVKSKKMDNAFLIDEETVHSPFEESLSIKGGKKTFAPLHHKTKKDRKMKEEIKARLNAGRPGSRYATSAPVEEPTTTTTTTAPEENTTVTEPSTGTPTSSSPKPLKKIVVTTGSSKKQTTTSQATTPAPEQAVTSVPEYSAELAEDKKLSMEIPTVALADLDEETLRNSLSKNIRRAPARYNRVQSAMSSDKEEKRAEIVELSVDEPIISIEKTASRMSKVLKMSKDGVKMHTPVDGEAMLIHGMLSMTTTTTSAPVTTSVANPSTPGVVSVEVEEEDAYLVSPPSDPSPSSQTPTTTVIPTTTVYNADSYFVTRKPIPYVWRPKVLTFCTKDDAVRDTNGMVVACGGESAWYPARCPSGTECFHADDSIYMICCPVASG